MENPLISVIIPVRNDFDRLAETILSIQSQSYHKDRIEFIITDDASNDGSNKRFQLHKHDRRVRVFRTEERMGVPLARNHSANRARGDILFITDAHVTFCQNWDLVVLEHLTDNNIIAATICDTVSPFKGYGCHLIVPFMGTKWNKNPTPSQEAYVQIASSAGTVITKSLFDKLGGYDSGMKLYGAAEPEFSVRAWLHGAEIISVSSLHVYHTFKTKTEIDTFISDLRTKMVHNNLRFGLLYLNEQESLKMIRHFAMIYPDHIQMALRLVVDSDVWQRRNYLRETLSYDFNWFVKRFNLKNQVGQEISI